MLRTVLETVASASTERLALASSGTGAAQGKGQEETPRGGV